MKRKGIYFILVLVTLFILRCGAYFDFDWFKRHYGMGFSDRMNITVVLNGKALPPSSYTLTYTIHGEDGDPRPANRTKAGYSIDSGYGVYLLSLVLDEHMIGFFVENLNNWWRTDIRLDVTDNSDGTVTIVQTEDVINDDAQLTHTRTWVK